MGRLEVGIDRGSLLQFYEAMWGPTYEAVLGLLGSTGVILPIGDSKHGQPNASTFTTAGAEQIAFTWSEPPGGGTGFDDALDLTGPASFQGTVPIVHFNGSDEEADTPDAAYWSGSADGTAGNEPALSVGAWLKKDTDTGSYVLSKYDATTASEAREWALQLLAGGGFGLFTYDESAGAFIGRNYTSAIALDEWHHLVGTYDASRVVGGFKCYLDGVAVDNGDNSGGAYTAMENTASLARLAFIQGASGPSNLIDVSLAGGPLGPFFAQRALTADEVLRLYEVGRRALGL